MTKERLITLTSRRSGLNHTESKLMLDATLNVLVGYLSAKKSITIPDFGTFEVRKRAGHRFFNIIRHKIMRTPQKYSLYFHPCKEYKENVQLKSHE